MNYNLDEVIDTLQESATEALKDGGTSEWGHRTLQIVEWLSDYRNFLKGSEDSCESDNVIKKGKWEMHTVDNGYNIDWKCSNCGFTMHTDFFGYRYCPKCGVEMESD